MYRSFVRLFEAGMFVSAIPRMSSPRFDRHFLYLADFLHAVSTVVGHVSCRFRTWEVDTVQNLPKNLHLVSSLGYDKYNGSVKVHCSFLCWLFVANMPLVQSAEEA
jgi:hypothetical protein